MRFLGLPLLTLAFALPAPSTAQNTTFLTDLLSELQSLGLTTLVSVASSLNNSAPGQALLDELNNGPATIFAPNNNACACSFCFLSRSVF